LGSLRGRRRAILRDDMATPHPTGARESGWLPDYVHTGGRFEAGLAFFADPLGRITRFSREPADLAIARRLNGMVALPGLVDGCAHVLQRLRRGRAAGDKLPALSADDVRDVARMVFVESLLSGVTCVAEYHQPCAGQDGLEAGGREVLRAAHEIGIRLALCPVATAGTTADAWIRSMESLRTHVASEHPGDELWLGAGIEHAAALPADQLKAIGAYAHAQRLRMLVPLAASVREIDACVAQTGRRPLQVLAEQGLADKRLVAVHGTHLSADEIKSLGAARAVVCVCPSHAQLQNEGTADLDALQSAGATISLGSGSLQQTNLLAEARQLPGRLRQSSASERAARLLHAMTVGGARSLGAPSGALEVGRPADFFTVNLYDPSIAGAGPEGLLEAIIFSLERRGVRDVWIGGRQRLSGGRHAQQGPVVARFAELAKRLGGVR
jgi:formimidoylglutamate deiminase